MSDPLPPLGTVRSKRHPHATQDRAPDSFDLFPSARRLPRFQGVLAQVAPDLVRGPAVSPYAHKEVATTAETKPAEVGPDTGPSWLSDRLVSRRRTLAAFLARSAEALSRLTRRPPEDALISLANRLSRCRESFLVLYNDDTDKYRPLLAQCNSKWCPVCSIERSLDRARRVAKVIEPAARTRSITHAVFTIPNCRPGELAPTRLAIVAAFRRLFGGSGGQSKPIPPFDKVEGRIWNLEVTVSKKRRDWHPHIHALLDTPFLNQATATAAWKTAAQSQGIFGKAWHVYLERVKGDDIAAAALELSKYIAKPFAPRKENAHLWHEMILALKGGHQSDSAGSLALPPLDRSPSGVITVLGGMAKWLDDNLHTDDAAQFLTTLLEDNVLSRIAAHHYSILDLMPVVADEPIPPKKRKRK